MKAPPEPGELLGDRFGLAAFRPGQSEVIEALLEHRAALAVFPTGGGKSLCYQLPALLFDGVTVVISPLIALMKDQIDFLRSRGIAAARLDSSLELDEVREVKRGMEDGSLKLLYVAPERFNNERFLEQLGRTHISLFAVDEAHCISEWGHNFRPDYLKLAGTARTLGAERVLALTATATPRVVEDICASFRIPREAAIVTGFHRPNLRLLTSPVAAAARDDALITRLRERPPGSGIVYVTLQKTAGRVAEALNDAGLPARPYHAGMKDEERVATQEWWRASDRGTVVATIAFGMGIDKADVRYVYHYNLPKSLESYRQEIGRAGRDGEPSIVELLGSREDVATLANFAYGDTPGLSSLRGVLAELLGGGREFDVNLYALARAHDIRPLVLRTLLTYLELEGVLRQGTPFYAGYKLKPFGEAEEIIGRFQGERRDFVRQLFARAKQGRSWYSWDVAAAAASLGQDRQRLVAALDYFAAQGWAEVQTADARQRFTRLVENPGSDALADLLSERFERREQQEIGRLEMVPGLVTRDGCQTNALLAYFGEERAGPCGHCTFCETGTQTVFPPLPPHPPFETQVEAPAFDALRREHPGALGEPRQAARFLCGLSSPALSRERLTRHPLYGALESHPFPAVLAWCRQNG